MSFLEKLLKIIQMGFFETMSGRILQEIHEIPWNVIKTFGGTLKVILKKFLKEFLIESWFFFFWEIFEEISKELQEKFLKVSQEALSRIYYRNSRWMQWNNYWKKSWINLLLENFIKESLEELLGIPLKKFLEDFFFVQFLNRPIYNNS